MILLSVNKGSEIMLDKDNLIQETENVIYWIKDYVEKSGAKGVVVRK